MLIGLLPKKGNEAMRPHFLPKSRVNQPRRIRNFSFPRRQNPDLVVFWFWSISKEFPSDLSWCKKINTDRSAQSAHFATLQKDNPLPLWIYAYMEGGCSFSLFWAPSLKNANKVIKGDSLTCGYCPKKPAEILKAIIFLLNSFRLYF